VALLPTSWRPVPSRLLPDDPGTYRGPMAVFWVTAVYLAVITVRSLIHLFSADGGAQSIATIDTDVEGGHNIIAIFGQWGATQLLLAMLLWVLLLRYRGLLPLVLLVLAIEPVLRGLSGRLKPIETVGTAPGAALNWVVLPVLVVLLYLSLCSAES
jgi:hypothetical protein